MDISEKEPASSMKNNNVYGKSQWVKEMASGETVANWSGCLPNRCRNCSSCRKDGNGSEDLHDQHSVVIRVSSSIPPFHLFSTIILT